MMKIVIIPIGEADQSTLDSIARALRESYVSETVINDAIPVPERTYNARRQQYHSTRILKALETLKPGGCDIVLGVIDQDLYVPELNFVFGEATCWLGLPLSVSRDCGRNTTVVTRPEPLSPADRKKGSTKWATPSASATVQIPCASCTFRTA